MDSPTPSWRGLVGQVVFLVVDGPIATFRPDTVPVAQVHVRDIEPKISWRSGVVARVVAVEAAGIWLASPTEESQPFWTFISFSSLKSACFKRDYRPGYLCRNQPRVTHGISSEDQADG